MKGHEIKYLMVLRDLNDRPGATQAELARSADMPTALVHRYLGRLTTWRMLRSAGRGRAQHTLTPKGRRQLHRASWELLAFMGGGLLGLRRRAVRRLRECAAKHGWSRAVLYGATPVAEFLRNWAAEAGIAVAAVCDEERAGEDIARLDDLDRQEYDCLILSDWERAEDAVLLRLLSEYGPVVNPFDVDGSPRPEWG